MENRVKIYYDVRMIENSGIGTTIQNALVRLAVDPDIDLTLLGDIKKISNFLPDFKGKIINWKAPIYSIKEQLFFPRPPRDAILLMPHYNAPIRFLKQAVVVVHDLIHLRSREFEVPHYRYYARFMLSRIVQNARRIICVSAFTREDLSMHFPEARKKSVVNYNGLNHTLFKSSTRASQKEFRTRYSLPDEYLLCVGIGKKHKNVDFIIKILAPFWLDGRLTAPLVLGGTNGKIPEYITRQFPNKRILKHLRVLPRLPEEELPLMYGAATLLVMPSLYEGFGFPVGEAMACGTPVLSSSACSLPEVGGDAVVYFDPHNPLEFTDALFRILNNRDELKRLSQAGLKQSKKFSWDLNYSRLKEILTGLTSEA